MATIETPRVRLHDPAAGRAGRAPRIVYVQYTDPAVYPPLEHSSRILADRGWKVLFLGVKMSRMSPVRFPAHPNITVRQLFFCPSGWRQKIHYLAFCAWVIAWVVWWRPRYVYASDYLSTPAAVLLSLLPGVRVIYHEHDSPAARGSWFMQLCLAARRRLTRRAFLLVLPGRNRAEQFAREVDPGREVVCVCNCPAQEEIGPPRPGQAGDDHWIFYHGSIGPSQLPETVLHALALLPARVKLRVVGFETIGCIGYVQQLRDLARHLGVEDRIEFLGTVPTRRELLQWCGRCDVGIAIFSENGHHQPMAGASNKPFDYLACGLALLVSDLPDWRGFYVEDGYALACDPKSPESIARALRWFLDHPDEMRALGERGRRQVLAEWNYEKQFAPVLACLEERGA